MIDDAGPSSTFDKVLATASLVIMFASVVGIIVLVILISNGKIT